jgi:hypothetical protein
MRNDNMRQAPLLPPEPPPSDLFSKVMSAVMLEPAPSWENTVHENAGRASLLANANGLVISILCAVAVVICSLLLWPEALITQIEESMRVTSEYAGIVSANALWLRDIVTSTFSLISLLVKTIGAFYTTGVVLLQIVGSGPLLNVVVLLGVCVVTGQIWLLRLLTQHTDAQPA